MHFQGDYPSKPLDTKVVSVLANTRSGYLHVSDVDSSEHVLQEGAAKHQDHE